MDRFTTPEGALGLAIVALLVVLGQRLARPARALDWLGVGAYAAALVAVHLAAGAAAARDPGAGVRLLGGATLVAGVLLAGSAMRARLREATRREGIAPIAPAERPRIHAGLALIVAGQLLREPTAIGAVAAAVACAALAGSVWRRPPRSDP